MVVSTSNILPGITLYLINIIIYIFKDNRDDAENVCKEIKNRNIRE